MYLLICKFTLPIHVIQHICTSAERFGAIPGPILGADDRRGSVSIHGKSRRTLESGGSVVGKIIPKPNTIGWQSGIPTVDYCSKKTG